MSSTQGQARVSVPVPEDFCREHLGTLRAWGGLKRALMYPGLVLDSLAEAGFEMLILQPPPPESWQQASTTSHHTRISCSLQKWFYQQQYRLPKEEGVGPNLAGPQKQQ